MSTTTNTNTTDAVDSCENCSSNFSIFKRKKSCNYCKQTFCQFCVSRPKYSYAQPDHPNGNSERICVTCQSIIEMHKTTDDLMKLKLKHLRAFLNTANVSTSTCRDKRDLAELVVKTKAKYERVNMQQHQAQNQQQEFQNQNQNTGTFNDRFTGFMNNVQDFVNFNLNSVLNPNNPINPVPCPAPPSTSSNSSQTQANTQGTSYNSTSSKPNNSSNNTFSNTNHSHSTSSSIPINLNSMFNYIGEQLPNAINQTLNSNLFTFNTNNINTSAPSQNVPNTANSASSSSASSSASSSSSSFSPSNENTNTNTAQNHRYSTLNTDNSSSTANEQPTSSAPQQTPRPKTPPLKSQVNLKRRASLSDLKTENDIENLTIKQIKEILASNFVEFKGCCEKKELIDKVKRLYRSDQENKQLEKELNSNDTASNIQKTQNSDTKLDEHKRADEFDLCKICMESLIDCVLLDCGHMCSCIKCGKQLGECPICRQYVVKVVRVFKS